MSASKTPTSASNGAPQTRGKPFERGNRAGRGRKAGSRNKASLAADALAQGELSDILQKVLELAKAGDLKAADMVLSRAWPARKGRPVAFTMPRLHQVSDIVAAIGAVAAAVSDGTLTPDEASAIAGVIETQSKAVESADLEKRVAALEATSKERTNART